MQNNVAQAMWDKHFEPCFAMLNDIIMTCPDHLWTQPIRGHAPIWQQVCHALAGTWVWFRPAGKPFQEPPMGEAVAEMQVIPDYSMTKEDVLGFAVEAKARAEAFLAMAGETLMAPYSFCEKVTNLDIIMDQIRHLQHHVGYCNCILGENGCAAPWQGTRM